MLRNRVALGFCILGFIIMLSSSVYAQIGTTAAGFLNTSLGARPSGMGNAFCAVADDVNAVLWNPAGLVLLDRKETSFTYTNLGPVFGSAEFGSMYDGFLGYALPLENDDALALSLQYQEQGTVAVTGDDPEVIAEYSLGANYAAIVSYAKNVSSSLSWGANLKFIQARLWEFSDTAYAVDIGGLYRSPQGKLNVGVSLYNMGTELKMGDVEQADPLPQNLKLGLSYRLVKGNPQGLLFAFDVEKPTASNTGTNIGLGVEYWYHDTLAVRLGYLRKEGEVEGMTQGLGIRYGNYEIDFANVPWGELGNVQRFSLSIRL